jgi:uncharacterized protein (TIGR00369 family)
MLRSAGMPTRHVEDARDRFARVPFAARLGVTVAELAPDHAVLVLPYRQEHMNAGGVLNGGASATLLTMTGALAAWSGVDLETKTDVRCVDLAVQYLDAGRDEDVVSEARVLRRGRDLAFLDVTARSAAGVALCHGLLTYQTTDHNGHAPRLRADPILLPAPSPLIAPVRQRLFQGYVSTLEIAPLHETPGRARLRMPCTPAHLDETGHIHAGALASLVDIAAVAASWSLVPRRPGSRGSTIAMQVSFPSTTAEAVIADAHVQQRAESVLFNTVHVTGATSGQLVAMGQVSYRLLEPWPTTAP